MRRHRPFFPLSERMEKDLDQVRKTIHEGLPAVLKPFMEGRETLLLPPEADDLLRPYLVLLTAHTLGCSGERVVRVAACVQMIRMASLLHDRLGTDSGPASPGEQPEGIPHQRESLDILLGDFLFSRASCIIIEDGERRIVEDMIRTSIASAEVQAALVSLERDPGTFTPSRCFETVAQKLSLLVSLGLRVGGMLGGASIEIQGALSDFGSLFGKALRIVRDLESWGTVNEMARLSRRSPEEFRYSFPLLVLWECEGKAAWEEAVLGVCNAQRDVLEAVRSRMFSKGYLRDCLARARGFADEAVSCLVARPGLEAFDELKALARDHLFCGMTGSPEGSSVADWGAESSPG